MRKVMRARPRVCNATRAKRLSSAADGAPATALCTAMLFLRRVFCGVLFVGIDDARDQRVPHHVGGGEIGECDAAHAGEDAARLDEAALRAAAEVDLRDVARDYRLGAEADA